MKTKTILFCFSSVLFKKKKKESKSKLKDKVCNAKHIPQVYQSLDRELQKHVNHQDTLQQCQTWLSTVQEELQLNDQGPSGLQEALKQVFSTAQFFSLSVIFL